MSRALVGCGFALLAASASCSKTAAGPPVLRHDAPTFSVYYPKDLVPGKDKVGTDGSASLSLANPENDRELFFLWAKKGTQYDPWGLFPTYGHEADNTKILDEGVVGETDGKYVVNDRSGRTFIHAVTSTGDYAVLCMASTSTAKPETDLLDACKHLMTH